MSFLAVILVSCHHSSLYGESSRSLVRKGNRAYEKEDFAEAEVEYRKALEKEGDLVEGKFNLGGALYKQERFDDSAGLLDEAIAASSEEGIKANAFYNKGNAQFKQELYRESCESYINSLKIDPTDMDTKYNLTYALKKLKELEKQQQEEGKGGKEDRQEQQEGNSGGPGESENEDREHGTQPPDQGEDRQEEMQQEEESETRPEERQISRSEAERILQALRENEMEVQKKLREPQGIAKVEKDW